MREDHGFLPDLLTSVRQNAQQVLGDTLPGHFFLSPSNLTFHNLTPGRSLPLATRIMMGMFTKFILPKAVTTKKHAIESFEHFEQDFGWKV